MAAISLALLAAVSISAQGLSRSKIRWEVSSEDGKVVITGTPAKGVDHVSGSIRSISCAATNCFSPEDFDFDITISTDSPAAAASEENVSGPDEVPDTVAESVAETIPESDTETMPESDTETISESGTEAGLESDAEAGLEAEPLPQPDAGGTDGDIPAGKEGLLSLVLQAVLLGLAMLLTPCVFPMVPMTVSFFIKGDSDRKKGKFKAFMYGLFIVLLYTVPICVIIGLTWLFGGSSVSADIFNWLATHWLPNLIFFLVFLVFALSFFGLFEITLPSKWVNSADGKSDGKGLGGVFFMALTLVLVSFSCTGPIVGTVLIKSVSGEFWTPVITMLAFSIAFALPFALLALFPGLLKRLPKSGGWLQTVKVSLGFIELALGLKFLSVADQTYHWGILPRNVYLTIWIVLFVLLILYLTGILGSDKESIRWSRARVIWLAIVTAFTIYLFTGMYGNPLKALAGYLPPVENTEDKGQAAVEYSIGRDFKLEDAQKEAARQGKRIFLDITGYGCVNCREMELRVLSDPKVRETLDEGFIFVKLYVDDKTALDREDWVTTDEGRVLKDAGRVNSYTALKRFGVNSQPNYFILDERGNILKGPYPYNTSISDFIEFLR